MGLAAFGEPRHDERFAPVVSLHDDGSFSLDPSYFADFNDPDLAYGPRFVERFGAPRPRARPWDLTSESDRYYADVAATAQHVVELAMLGLARRTHHKTGASTLCLAGGVALNAVANRRIQEEGPFETVWVQPAAGDAGGALGAALLGAITLGDVPDRNFDPFLGLPTDAPRAMEVATALGLQVTRHDDPTEALAARLERDDIVGLCTGRCEWGPRALGGRSLLANPTTASTRDTLNARVKRREPFRPFAPAVRTEACETWFVGAPDAMTPMMTTVREVRRPGALEAVTHVDGTARVQTVSEGPLRALLERIPVVLNTSLNGGGEPICGTEVDALSFFLKHPIDALFIDDLEVSRP